MIDVQLLEAHHKRDRRSQHGNERLHDGRIRRVRLLQAIDKQHLISKHAGRAQEYNARRIAPLHDGEALEKPADDKHQWCARQVAIKGEDESVRVTIQREFCNDVVAGEGAVGERRHANGKHCK
jgi:hypothetical protein